MMAKLPTVGSDPEFLIFKGNSFVPASDVLNVNNSHPTVGTDGCSSTGEIRPEYSSDPIGHFNNVLMSLTRLEELMHNAGDFEIRAGSGNPNPIGGHIHFGIKKDDNKIKNIVDMLDLASLILVSVEEKNNNIERRCGSYGYLGDFRHQDWGFEYRTPASWLVSPGITRGFLTMYYTIAYEGLAKKNKKFADLVRWYKEHDVITPFNFAKPEAYSFVYGRIKEAIKSCVLYPKYHNYIDSMFSLIELGRCWDEKRDILESWGLKKPNIYGSLRFSKDEYIEEIIKMVNIKANKPIYIYGLNQKRKDFDIATSSPYIASKVNDINSSLNLGLRIVVNNIRGTNSPEIGFAYCLRKDRQELISIILNGLINKLNKDKNNYYGERMRTVQIPVYEDEEDDTY